MTKEIINFGDYVIIGVLAGVLTVNIPNTIYNFITDNHECIVLAKY